MNDKEFEEYWQANRERLLNEDAEYRRATSAFKVNSGADWLLYAIPVVAGIAFLNNSGMKNELANWLLSAAITIVCFALCVVVKSIITDVPSIDNIEKRVKKANRDKLIRQQKSQ